MTRYISKEPLTMTHGQSDALDCLDDLKGLRNLYGTSTFDHAVKSLMRQRLDAPGRPKRVHVSLNARWEMYRRQKGICPLCNKEMAPDEKIWDVDHIEPDSASYNGRDNTWLTHSGCNRSKGAKSLLDLSKESGKTIQEFLEGKGGEEIEDSEMP